LIDHCAAVHHVYESARDLRTERPGNEPDGHGSGLSEASRDVERMNRISSKKASKKVELPRKRELVLREAKCAT
jgi:hypothetical protein